MMNWRILYVFLLIFCPFSLFAQSDYGATESDWVVSDNKPAGALISVVSEPMLAKSVVETSGAGRTNAYRTGGTNESNGWNNQNEFLITWRLQASEAVNVYVRVDTELGWRYLQYNQSTKTNLLNRTGRYIHHGLGPDLIDGNWHTWTRDLASDLQAAEPENQLLAVHGFQVRGNMRIDGVQLNALTLSPQPVISTDARVVAVGTSITLDGGNSQDTDGSVVSYVWRDSQGTVIGELSSIDISITSIGQHRFSLEIADSDGLSAIESIELEAMDISVPTIYSDAELSGTDGWRVADKTPIGATVQIVPDPDNIENNVVQFSGSALQNSFINGYTNPARGWDNQLQTNISWRSRADEDFRVYARVTTLDGWRYIWYDTRTESKLSNNSGLYIHHALGESAKNGQWQTFTRDLQADLAIAEPDNIVTAVHAVVVRGSFMLDDLSLVAEAIQEPPSLPLPDVPTNLTPVVDVQVEAGATQTFTWESQSVAAAYDFHLFDRTNGDLTFVYDIEPAQACAHDVCTLDVVVSLPIHPDHAWRVRAKNETGISGWSRSEFDVIEPVTVAPDAPIVLLPEQNTEFFTDATVVLQWQFSATASQYDFELRTLNGDGPTVLETNSFEPAAICTASICTLAKQNELPVGDAYQLSVRASNRIGDSNWSDVNFSIIEEIIEPPVSAPLVPTNDSPLVDAQIAADATQTFTWLAVEFAAAYDFHLFDRTNGDLTFVYDINPADACVDSACSLDVLVALPVHPNHAWRVRAKNASGISGWSRSEFDVVEPVANAPDAPTIIFPDENTVFDVDAAVVLEWQADTMASSYDFGLVNPYTETTVYNSAIPASEICNTTTCTLSEQNALPVGEGYELRIRAINVAGSSEWSSRTFSIANQNPIAMPSASFTVSTLTGTAPLTVSVDASSSTDANGISNYVWEFSSSDVFQGAELVSTTHEFVNPGSYPVKLTVSNESGASDSHVEVVTVIAAPPANAPSDTEAARLLAQASFGATDAAIAQVRALGIEGWIDTQFTLQGPAHLDYVQTYSNGSNRDARHEIWWKDAIDGEDQLRGRVAFALSQLFVVSDTGFTLANAQYGIANYYDILRNHAFGNYRELLEQVTLSPVMGIYLSMLQNDKGDEEANTRADENFAREVLQLFSIGLHNLNQDGTRAPGNTFTQAQREDFARVFTGWNYKDAGRWDRPLFTGQDLINPMEPYEDHHDMGEKTLLNGVTLPAGQSARADLEQALDIIAQHANVAPFISRHLISQLVTSNPSNAYIGRVAAVFNDNGSGVKGDLRATVKAILMDEEARAPTELSEYGKLREPVLRLTHLWRAFSITPGNNSVRGEYNTYSPALKNLESITGQAVLRSPSVFNFFAPGYFPNSSMMEAEIQAPEFSIFTDGNILGTASRINSQVHRHYKQNPSAVELNPSYLDYTAELELAGDPQSLLDRLNLLLLSGSMSSALNDLLLTHLTSLPSDEAGLRLRVQDAISLMVASPEYLVQK